MSPSQSLTIVIPAARTPTAIPVKTKTAQTWLASRSCRTYPTIPGVFECKILCLCLSFEYSKIQSIAVRSSYPTLRPGPSTYQSNEVLSLVPRSSSGFIPPLRGRLMLEAFLEDTFRSCKTSRLPVKAGDGDLVEDKEGGVRKFERLKPGLCFVFLLKDVLQYLSASYSAQEYLAGNTAEQFRCLGLLRSRGIESRRFDYTL